MIRKILFILPIILSGCQTISDGADHVGSYMPTITERCYHWQCFTSEGQAISDRNRAIEEGLKKTPPAPQPTPSGVKPTTAKPTTPMPVPTK